MKRTNPIDRKYEALRAELLKRYTKQRAMTSRGSVDPSLWDCDLLERDTKFLKKVVKRYGWPRIPDVGQDGAQAAWQILQLADHDVPFQERCLELMKVLPKGQVQASNIAYLEDRILSRQGKLQLYGTQHGDTASSRSK